MLGRWQKIFFCELDRARPRKVFIQVSGTDASERARRRGRGGRLAVRRPRRGCGAGQGCARELPRRAAVTARAARRRLERSTGTRGSSTTPATTPATGCALLDWIEADLDARLRRPTPSIRCCSGSRRSCASSRCRAIRSCALSTRTARTSRCRGIATWDELRATASCRRTRSASSCCTCSARRRRSGSRCRIAICTGAAARRALQDVAEDFGRGRDLRARGGHGAHSASPRTTSRARRAGHAVPALMAFEVERARGLLADGAAAGRALSGRASARDRRATSAAAGRRSTRSSAPATTCCGRPAPPTAALGVRPRRSAPPGGADERLPSRPRTRHCRERDARERDELLLRHAAAAGRRAETRCTPSTRSRGGSTTSPTGRCRADDKLAALEQARADVGCARGPRPSRPGADRARRCRASATRCRCEALSDLIDGADDGRAPAATYETFDDLVVYCRRVGRDDRSAVARESSARRTRAPGRWRLADDLGVAFQLTNILRDVQRGSRRRAAYTSRREDLDGFGCRDRGRSARRRRCRSPAIRGRPRREWYERGLGLAAAARPPECLVRARRWRGSTGACCGGSSESPRPCSRGRLSLPGWEKGWVAARSLVGAGGMKQRAIVCRRRAGGHHRGARLRRRRRAGDAARGASAARRRDLLGREGRAAGWTTASTSSCAAAPSTGS